MIAVIKSDATENQVASLIQWLRKNGVEVHRYPGNGRTILGMIGDISQIDTQLLQSMQIVESVRWVSDPFKQANRKFHPQDTIVNVGDVSIGGGSFALIAGPCSIESEEQLLSVALSVKASGAKILRGGAFKPRTSPYSFQGLKEDGLRILLDVKKATGLPVITEIMTISSLDLFQDVDIIQVGARNMQNFDLLTELGRSKKPVLLKRGLANTLQELLMSAEYIMREGNENIILCERGIRTFETFTRNTMDISAIPVLRELSHLPVIADPSHATGISRLVPPMALASVAAGADGIMVEVHNDPEHALCDGAQALTPAQFAELSTKIHQVRNLTV